MRLRRSFAIVACVIAAATASLYWQLRPPAALHAPAPWPGLANVTVVNPGRGRLAKQTILLRGDRIETIRDTGAADPGDVRLRTFARRYVLPGLIDLRVRQPPPFMHLQRLVGLMYLGAGVTTVRDVGNFDGALPAMQAEIRDGTLVFPRLVACARVLEGNPSSCPQSRTVRDAADAEPAVAEVAAAAGQCVHVRRNVTEDLRAAIDAAARSRQLPVVAEEAPAGAAHIPMLARWHLSAIATTTTPPAGVEPFQTFLPPVFRAVIWPAQVAHTTKGLPDRTLDETFVRTMRSASALREAAVSLRLGTGAPSLYAAPGGSARVELEALTSTGLSREEVWAAATRGAGELLGVPQLGSIEPGAPADLLVFREDPTQSVEAYATLEAVISQGRLFPSSVLLGQLMEHARYAQRWVVATLLTLQARWMLWWDPATLVECQLP